MARVKIHLPSAKSIGSLTVPVRITDINYGNHLSNNGIVEIVHEARMQFLVAHGYTEMEAGGISLIMNELVVEYKNESFYGDILQVELFCGDITRISFELYYQISTQREQQNIEIALAKTGMVGYDYTLKRVNSLTNELKKLLTGN